MHTACAEQPQKADNSAFIFNDKTVLHPIFRIEPTPSGDRIADVNPPSFLIPLTDEDKSFKNGVPVIKDPVYYSFRLSKDESFPADGTFSVENSEWALFNPHKKLEPGNWYWQYRSSKTDWSEIQQFRITKDVPVFVTPTFEELLELIPKDHPRMLVPDGDIEKLRDRNRGNEDYQRIVDKADKMLGVDPPSENLGQARKEGETDRQNKKLDLDASKVLGNKVYEGIDPLTKAYVLTGDKKYAKEAIRWAMHVATFDPYGVSWINDFGDSYIMLMMASVYDACYDQLDSEQKEKLIKNITARAERFYQSWRNSLEAKVYSGHDWQHIIERHFKTSLALLGDVPEAHKWLNFVYELFLARSPVLGRPDGGWWNGSHYFKLNALTLLEIPQFLKLWTGQDYLQSPFYENNPYWLIYSFPANSFSEGFGNGTEKQFGQNLGTLGYADALARLKQNPYAAWYADYQLKNGAVTQGYDPTYYKEFKHPVGHTIYDDDEFRWFRIQWELPDLPSIAENIDELPLARVFRETGSVNMHTDLLNAENNLMVSMRSSPYGSSSHSHANQNAFNIQYGGEKLFYNSGYRPAMSVPHYDHWFKATIGQNSILIDGQGQPINSGESYGWIPRFLHGETISYVLGDASKAYDNVYNKKQEAGMKLFRRHIAFLRPSIIVIYDELEADHDAEWTWLLHSPYEIKKGASKNEFLTQNPVAESRVDQFASAGINYVVDTKYDPEPVNFRDIMGPDGKVMEYHNQWHLYAKSSDKHSRFRYLTILQIVSQNDQSSLTDLKMENGKVRVGDWEISAELNTSEESSFKFVNQIEKKALGYNLTEIILNGESIVPKTKGSSILIEQIAGKEILKEVIDRFPDAN